MLQRPGEVAPRITLCGLALLTVLAGCRPDARTDAGAPDGATEGTPDAGSADGGPSDASDGGSEIPRLIIQPVLYFPSDASLSADERGKAKELIDQHLQLARSFYLGLLVTDTFRTAPAVEHPSTLSAAAYQQASAPDSAHLMAQALLQASAEDRNASVHVFIAVFVRPAAVPCGGSAACLGAGRTFNGYPGSGGGIIQLEYTSLTSDQPYPFQSTLVHELGHAFGLVHSDCLGEDLQTGRSIMSYNPAHWSQGLKPSPTPGELLPEEYFLLDGNGLAFPKLTYVPSLHNPTQRPLVGVDGTCELGAMDSSIGNMARLGYQLFFGGAQVSGPDAKYYTRGQALGNCAWNIEHQAASVAIRCLFDGELIGSRE